METTYTAPSGRESKAQEAQEASFEASPAVDLAADSQVRASSVIENTEGATTMHVGDIGDGENHQAVKVLTQGTGDEYDLPATIGNEDRQAIMATSGLQF